MKELLAKIRMLIDGNTSSNSKRVEVGMYDKGYEEYLENLYGRCGVINGNLKLMIIADTHGTLDEKKFIEFVHNNSDYDACIMVGDHSNLDVEIILRNINKTKLYGILGNHDYDYLSNYKITNINGKVIEINNIKILGMEGSFKYKLVKFPSFTQEESLEFLKDKEAVDILITHDKKFDPEKLRDPAHQGLIGITNYLYQKKVPIHIHGHIHEAYKQEMFNGTVEYSVFGYDIININGNK